METCSLLEESRAELKDEALTFSDCRQPAEAVVVVAVREVFPAPPAGTQWDGLGVPVREGFSRCITMVSAALRPVGLVSRRQPVLLTESQHRHVPRDRVMSSSLLKACSCSHSLVITQLLHSPAVTHEPECVTHAGV